MRRALDKARQAESAGEVPVGAVLLDAAGSTLAEAANAPITGNDPTAHAEMQAMRRGASKLGNYRLDGSILVVTLEPCLMCFGAMIHARIGGLVFGAPDPKAGTVVSKLRGLRLPFLNHRFPVVGGVLEGECGAVLRDFFRKRRKNSTSG